jgi:hypothetical protein
MRPSLSPSSEPHVSPLVFSISQVPTNQFSSEPIHRSPVTENRYKKPSNQPSYQPSMLSASGTNISPTVLPSMNPSKSPISNTVRSPAMEIRYKRTSETPSSVLTIHPVSKLKERNAPKVNLRGSKSNQILSANDK